jgi:hypothetical protein
MERKGIERFAPLTGLVFFVLLVASLIIAGDGPTSDDSLAETVEHWKDDETNQIIAAALSAYAAFAFLWFAGSVREAVAQAEPEQSRLASISFGGAVVIATSALISASLEFTAAEASDEISPQALEAISVVYDDMFIPFLIGFALFLLAAGVAAVRHGAFDRWLGWMAIVIGVLCLIPFVGFAGFAATLAWVLIASIVLYRKKDPVGSGAEPPPRTGPEIEVPPGASS